MMAKENQSNEPSALSEIVHKGVEGATSPSKLAQIAGAFAPPGTEHVVAQGLQAAANMAVKGSEKFMEATVRQHGRSPSAVLQDLKIQQAIGGQKSNEKQQGQNKGIDR
jgi:hypothetical protein